MKNAARFGRTHFNIGVIGFLDNDDKADAAHVKVTSALAAITERVLSKEHEYYKTPQDRVRFDLYTSPLLAGDFWVHFCQHWNMGDLCVVAPENCEETPLLSSSGAHKTIISNTLKGIAQIYSMIDWVACQIDIAFALWDGNDSTHDGSVWMFIERCKQNGVPCIWIDITDYEKSYWFKNIYPEPFNREALWQHIDGFYKIDALPEDVSQVQPHGYLFSKLWARASRSYEKRHGAEPVFDETKAIADNREPVQFEDVLLHHQDGQFNLERQGMSDGDSEIISENFKFLRGIFHAYEDAADRISPAIRATLFCRTWTPMLSMIFLAAGFYAETMMRFIVGKYNLMLAGRWSVDTWAFIAGIGFLLSAFMFFYNRLNAKPYQSNLDNYIICRYVNEYFRIVLHFVAYGMPVSERVLNRSIRDAEDPMKQRGAIRVRRLLRMRTPSAVILDAENCANMIEHLSKFFDTQIAYQTVGRKLRFEGLSRSVSNAVAVLLWVNLTVLALRGVFQFIAGSLPQVDTLAKDSPLYWLSYSSGGKNVVDFARSFANFAALLIAAWYEKYTRQRDMNHYGGYAHIAGKILSELRVYKGKTAEIVAMQKSGILVSYERLRSLTEDTLESLTAELYWWCDLTAHS